MEELDSRTTERCDPSADSSPEWMAAFRPPPGQPAAPSKKRRNFVQNNGVQLKELPRWQERLPHECGFGRPALWSKPTNS
jgi:hypothetical protein